MEDDECPPGGSGCVDWKTTPMDVLEEVDGMLHSMMMEIVIIETSDDSIIWTIEHKEE